MQLNFLHYIVRDNILIPFNEESLNLPQGHVNIYVF